MRSGRDSSWCAAAGVPEDPALLRPLIYALTFAGGLYMAFRSVEELTLGLESRAWPGVEGRVLVDDRDRRFYGYLVDGRAHAGERIRFPAGLPGQAPGELPAEYAPGQEVRVFYAPDGPHVSVLQPGVWIPGIAAGFGIAAVMVPAGVLGLRRWRAGRTRESGA
jgi:hypothetical protein